MTLLSFGLPVWNYYGYVLLFWFSTNFISQLFLTIIFWDLGNKDKAQLEEESFEGLPVTEDFDDEANLQAHIWNKFQRQELHARSPFIISLETLSTKSLSSR